MVYRPKPEHASDKEAIMTPYISAPDPITPAWLTDVLRGSGVLAQGHVLAVESAPTGAFNSHTSHLQLHYSNDVTPALTANMILKRNIHEPWAIEAGVQDELARR